jgi:hypothetical protein
MSSTKETQTMLSQECLREFRTLWLPNITDTGLERLVDLLEKGSPLLIHGSFSRAFPMGCLATHIAWNHPATEQCVLDAGIIWLNRVAGLNPVSSRVIREWDQAQESDFEVRAELLTVLKEYRTERRNANRTAKRVCGALAGSAK